MPRKMPFGGKCTMIDTSVAFIYVTTRHKEEALSIGRALVKERLAAGVNILEALHSLYWWEEKFQEAREAALIAKTRSGLVPQVIARIRDLHSYEVPCVAALPVADGNPDFLAWVNAQTRPGRQATQLRSNDAHPRFRLPGL